MLILNLSLFSPPMPANFLFTIVLGMLCFAGCTQRGPSVSRPSYSAAKISSAAMEALDVNHDGSLDAGEIEKTPGMKAALKNIDENNDGRISSTEIEGRIDAYRKSRIGLRNETYTFALNSAPLA